MTEGTERSISLSGERAFGVNGSNMCKGPELKVLLVCLRSKRVLTVARSKRERQ